MRTNLEKWNHYLSIINDKLTDFMNSQKANNNIPEYYYVVRLNGEIAERKIIDMVYSERNHNNNTRFTGKKPTKKDVASIMEYSMTDIPFSTNNIYLKYSEVWDKENNRTSRSSDRFDKVMNNVNIFHTEDEAIQYSKKIIENNRIEREYRELHKKDSTYNYSANGYRFLGWQNGWTNTYYDEDGNLCEETGKPRKSFGYSKENYPEYNKCIDLKHLKIEVSHNRRGSENTVSCPICKIYWKYDSSD